MREPTNSEWDEWITGNYGQDQYKEIENEEEHEIETEDEEE